MSPLYRFLAHLLPVLAILVVVKGAYVRLSDAGLGCPDWPGCYGQLLVPGSSAEVTEQKHLAARPLETGKAWLEMIHRYMASTLGVLILLMAWSAWRNRATPGQPTTIAYLLIPFVMFQGMLGMWTVTLLLKPLIVTAHLLGGITLLSLLAWNLCAVRAPQALGTGLPSPRLVTAAIGVLAVQIFLGGWTSTNYAALACTDFPQCHGSWWPQMNFNDAFVLWRGLGVNYEFGVLDTPARTAIHYSHRLWAMVAAAVVFFTAWRAVAGGSANGRRIGWCIIVALILQVSLGITNVLRGLPLPVAVLHNGTAALLMASLVALLYHATRPRTTSTAASP